MHSNTQPLPTDIESRISPEGDLDSNGLLRGANDTKASPSAANAVEGSEPRVLSEIQRPDVNLSTWRRQPLGAVRKELATVMDPRLDLRCHPTSRTFSRDVKKLLFDTGLDPSAFPNWLADMTLLAGLFFEFSGRRRVMVRIETTNDDGCRRYHVDRSALRMLCTYRGPGTEWLAEAQVNHAALDATAPNEDIVQFGAPFRMSTFAVGLFKGSLYPEIAGRGLVHRSPSIAGTGQLRVRFCLVC